MYYNSDINDCNHSSCLHGATCIDDVNDYHCDCVDGYYGKHCETGKLDSIANQYGCYL